MPREFDSGVPVPGNRYVWPAPWQRCVPAPGEESRLRRPPPPRPRGRARRRARLQRGQPRPGRRVDPTSPGGGRPSANRILPPRSHRDAGPGRPLGFHHARWRDPVLPEPDAGPGPRAAVDLVARAPVREAIQAIAGGGEVRAVILACFQRFCTLLGSRGITKQDPLTPRELERLAVDRLRFSREDSATLTSLFEEARYSEHPLGDLDRARAIDSLGKIRVALEG